jgi:hypothetical protein
METIHPNNIQDLNRDEISLITLKNGNMIMIDDSAPEKPNKEKTESGKSQAPNVKKQQPFEISKRLTISFKGEEYPANTNKYSEIINNNKKDDNNNKIIVKSDFNKISSVAKITNFTYAGKPRQNLGNNIPTLPINNYSNLILLNNKNNNNDNDNYKNNINIPKSLNNFSPMTSMNDNNIKVNKNINQNELLTVSSKRNEDNISSNNIIIVNNEENKEEEDISARIRRKSKNYLEKIDKLIGDMNKPTIKAVISLNIPSDVQKEISKTQKQFDQLVVQLRQKQNKYRKNKSEMNYPKYYEFYKNDKFNETSNPNFNRIKYYQESEKDDLENNLLFGGNDNLMKSVNMNNNGIALSSNNRSFYDNINNKLNNTNRSINLHNRQSSMDCSMNKTISNFYVAKNKTMNSSMLFNSKQRNNISSLNSGLIFPSNRCRSKLNPFY